ncbi:hypothetical protein [Shinella zoogloeoides]|uniref:hypothetical protein n=1 Tax=Shinella zoogloeoides TaxID=352475 RepID=UPI00299D0D44|nr:hypothetical protein [Shinella zoogloeoides]
MESRVGMMQLLRGHSPSVPRTEEATVTSDRWRKFFRAKQLKKPNDFKRDSFLTVGATAYGPQKYFFALFFNGLIYSANN